METTTGMSAPPMGMMNQHPDGEREQGQRPERDVGFRAAEPHRESHDQYPEDGVEEVLSGEDDGAAGYQALELGERHHGACEGDGADGRADGHLDEARDADAAHRSDAVGIRGVQRGGGHQDGGHAHEAVKGGDELGHGGHRDAARDDGTDAPAEPDAQRGSGPR